jgi:hypothetical protein
MTRLLFGVKSLDSLTYAGVICLIAMTVVIGCLLPVYRTTQIDSALVVRRD